MPIDSDGNRAEVAMDSGSRVDRMNFGGLFALYFGAATRDVAKDIRKQLGLPQMPMKKAWPLISKMPKDVVDNSYRYLMGYLNIVSKVHYEDHLNIPEHDYPELLASIVDEGIFVIRPTDTQEEKADAVRQLEKSYRPVYGPVSYIGDSGKQVTTKSPVRIAPLYMMLLEKIADDGSSVSSAKLQHFGILSPITKGEKYSHPFRNSAVQTIGNTEARLFAAYCGPEAVAEMIDRSNSPLTHKHVMHALHAADQPSNIDQLVDRNEVPYGNSKSLQHFRHLSQCSGWVPVHKKT